MMMFTNFNPGTAFAPAMPTALFDTWSGVAGLYRNAMEASAQQWVMSSANIIQQHTLQAVINASQACADALAKNAVEVQQQSLARYTEANQKAFELMGNAWLKAWVPGGRA